MTRGSTRLSSPRSRTRHAKRRRRTQYAPASQLLKHLAKVWRCAAVGALRIRFNPRLTRTLARCLPTSASIELSQRVKRAASRLFREVLVHEAAHYVVATRDGNAARPHGTQWRALVEMAGFEPEASRVVCGGGRLQRKVAASFLHVCPVCHYSRRAGRHVTTWRCPECRALGLDGELDVERVD